MCHVKADDNINTSVLHKKLALSPPQRFPRVFRGGEEQAREMNLLEDSGRDW